MSKALGVINEIKVSQLKKGAKVKIKEDNFRLKGKEATVISVDDPTGDEEDILIKVKVDNKEFDLGLEELQ